MKKKPVFIFSLVASSLFLISVMFGQKYWSDLWLIYALIQIGLFLLFLTSVVWGIIYYGRKNKEQGNIAFLPVLINTIFLSLIIFLPLNKISNRAGFIIHKNMYNTAANEALTKEMGRDGIPKLYKLPKEYRSLSVGGGEVLVLGKGASKGVLFYTFRGTPEGKSGFLKINEKGEIGSLAIYLNAEVEELGDNWYFVVGD